MAATPVPIPHVIEPCGCVHSVFAEQIACDVLDMLGRVPAHLKTDDGEEIAGRITEFFDALERGFKARSA